MFSLAGGGTATAADGVVMAGAPALAPMPAGGAWMDIQRHIWLSMAIRHGYPVRTVRRQTKSFDGWQVATEKNQSRPINKRDENKNERT